MGTVVRQCKSRAAYAIIRHAVESGALNDEKILLDATSGNTGIAYAAIGKKLGIRVMLCVPENVTRERKQILSDLGAEIIYTSRYEGTDGAQLVAREMVAQAPERYFMPTSTAMTTTGKRIMKQPPWK